MSKKPKKERIKKPFNVKRAVIIGLSAFLSLVLVFGAVLGIVTLVKRSGSVAYYDGIYISEGVASFFVGRFKTQYIRDLRLDGYEAQNTENFWNSKYDDTQTHGDIMRSLAEMRIKQIIACNYFFDRNASLSDRDEEKIEKAIRETLEYHTGGSVDEFNRMAEEYGFDYDDYCEAVKLMYKSDLAFTAIFGQDGSRIASDNASCEDYLSEYSHVKLLFIRTEDKLVIEDDKSTSLVMLSEEEREERLANIDKVNKAIEAYKNGSDGQITPVAFDNYISTFGEGDTDFSGTGYYFHEDSEFSSEFSEQFPSVVEEALGMDIGEYSCVKVDFADAERKEAGESSPGVCFIYKYPPSKGAYATSSLSACFSDFYLHAASAVFLNATDLIVKEVVIGPKYEALDFIKISTNSVLYPRYDA